jgi:hypothetical protein
MDESALASDSDRFEEKEPDGSLRHLPGKCAVRVLEVSADRRWPPAGAGNSPLFVVRRPLGANLVAEMASNAHIFGNVSLGVDKGPIMAR